MKAHAYLLFAVLQLPLPAVAQYGLDVWRTEHGLPQNVVRDVHQTRDGYLWVVTMDGLARFDGVRFRILDRSTAPGLETNRFLVVHESPSGELWLGSEEGVARYRDGAFTMFTATDGLPDPVVRAITGDEAGRVWVLSGTTIVEWRDGRFQAVSEVPDDVQFQPSSWDPSVMFGRDTTAVYRFARGRLTRFSLPAALHGLVDTHFAQEASGTLWVSLRGALVAAIGPDGSYRTYVPEAAVPTVEYVDRRGRRWTVALDRQLTRTITIPGAAPLHYIGMEEDREGHLWFATFNQGLYRLRDQAVRILSEPQGLAGRNVYPVLEDRDGAIWAGTWNGGLSRYHQGRFTTFLTESADTFLPSALAEDAAGRLWIASLEPNAGLRVYEKGRLRSLERIVPDPTDVAAILHDRDGTVWLGSTRGLIRYRDGRATFFTIADGLAGNDIKVLIADPAGGLWAGGVGGVTNVRDGAFRRWSPREGLPNATVRALYLDRDGVLWVGTYDGGLVRLHDGRVTRVTTEQGLFNNGAFQILEDDAGFLWMSCNRGVYRVSKAELNALADGRADRVNSLALGRSDGLLNAEANGGRWPAGVRGRDGTLWFPTQDGLAVIDPSRVGGNLAPLQPIIESVAIDRQDVPFDGGVTLSPRQKSLEIEYTALSFVNSEHIRFRYRLVGLDEHWIEARMRRVAYYSHVRPGSYVFEVIAANSDGVWSAEPRRLAVTVRPPFYQTAWFVGASLVTVAGLAFGGFRRRIARLEEGRKTQEAFSRQLIASQEQERRRIAAELHDGLGQSLIVIRNWAALGAAPLEPGAGGREELDEIVRAADRAIGEMREMAYNLAPYNLERLGLADSLGEMVDRIQRASGLTITQQLDALNGGLSRDVETNLYRVAQEALNNIVKHSAATAASVSLTRANGAVRLTITDNGVGFDPARVARGMGLAGMADRIRLFDGEYSVRSRAGAGTTIEVVVRTGDADAS